MFGLTGYNVDSAQYNGTGHTKKSIVYSFFSHQMQLEVASHPRQAVRQNGIALEHAAPELQALKEPYNVLRAHKSEESGSNNGFQGIETHLDF